MVTEFEEQKNSFTQLYWPSPAIPDVTDECTFIYREPAEIHKVQANNPTDDGSDLFLLFFNTTEMDEAREYLIRNQAELAEKKFLLQAFYNLWGDFDTVVLFRYPNDADRFVKDILVEGCRIKKEKRAGVTDLIYHLYNISKELSRSEIVQTKIEFRRTPMKTTEYEAGYFTRAFVVFDRPSKFKKFSAAELIDRIKQIGDGAKEYRSAISIIDAIYETSNGEVILNALMTCQQPKLLGKISNELDRYVDDRGRRSTYIAYFCEEYPDSKKGT